MPDEPRKGAGNEIRAVPLDEVRRARGETKVAMPRSKVASLRAFRRIRADRAFGAIGLLLLIIGIALIFSWEKPPVIEPKYGVEWPQNRTVEPLIVGQPLAAGAPPRTGTYDLTVPNATTIVFTLLWEDQIGDQAIEADALELSIEGPEGVNLTNATILQTAKQGNITIPVPLNGIPDIASVPASTEKEAFAAVGDRTNRTGVGTWTYSVRVVSAPGDVKNEAIRNPQGEAAFCDPALPDNANCTPDGFQDYRLEISYITYDLRLKKL